uniref:SET domain-containing protein n=1 Tax=Corethron hystrix TaxID=216773 RepID=A0A7S1BZ69_9STRA|mmetsp:Transcript_7706/g.16729  ORF Transcript_7706/g.16729 Transcript_7706/m.16729 type:complete len:270 (+) Transcript_7706:268-1077(+)
MVSDEPLFGHAGSTSADVAISSSHPPPRFACSWATVWVSASPSSPSSRKKRCRPPSLGSRSACRPIRCNARVRLREGEPVPIPYCRACLRTGDVGALCVVTPRPEAGKCLVARTDLPRGYRMAFFGRRGRCPPCSVDDRAISYYPPNRRTGRNTAPGGGGAAERRLVQTNYNGVLRPEGTGDIIQYAACPGPGERQNMRSTFQYWGVRNGHLGGLEFVTTEKVKAGTQLCHWYGNGWFVDRGLKRLDVGTDDYPVPKRKRKLSSKSNMT